MRRPIRLNRAIWPAVMHKLQRGLPDPRALLDKNIGAALLSETLQRLKFGATYKATDYDRFPQTTRLLSELAFADDPVVLDVGASDGSAALAVMQQLRFARYYVTDRHIKAHAYPTSGGMFLCDMDARPWLYANRCFVVHNDLVGAAWPYNAIAARIFKAFDSSKHRGDRDIYMINPDLAAQCGERICVEQYNIFNAWQGEKTDLLIAANLLNRDYFSDTELCAGLRNLRGAMHDGAVLAVIENRKSERGPIEQSSLFRRAGNRFVAEAQIGVGSDIHELVLALE